MLLSDENGEDMKSGRLVRKEPERKGLSCQAWEIRPFSIGFEGLRGKYWSILYGRWIRDEL